MVANRPPGRVVVERHHRSKVTRGQGRFTRTQSEVPRQLRPECGLERQVLSGNSHPRICEVAAREGHVVVEYLQPSGARRDRSFVADVCQHLQTEVMLTHDELVASE